MFDLPMAIQLQQAASIASREPGQARIIMAVPRLNVATIINVQVIGAGGAPGTTLTVNVNVSHPMIILPFLIPGIFPANPVPLVGTTIMNLE
jgi:hypothetical protein